MELQHYKITISGKVQGVGFRVETRKIARAMGVKGTVQNQPDGSVLIVAEANEELMKHFMIWCHQGPDGSEVKWVSVAGGELVGYESFEIV
jgi:acylphosphatase